MKALFGAIVLLAVAIVCVGFYQGWFHITTPQHGQPSQCHDYVDQKNPSR